MRMNTALVVEINIEKLHLCYCLLPVIALFSLILPRPVNFLTNLIHILL